ncbi:MAG: 6,7-dimethyl-8-ribityllumazine synthase [Gammaproteobacteria bacterium RIFCSPHIGHO2_12_FULL_45_9]|nr:MAG: 6,7-dimethyl-8-ribityllumazine synthase [Gammaproteobacteria bacterium RIFCSPHIGHO2_12_FULL_45_9]
MTFLTQKIRIAIIVGDYHRSITEALLTGSQTTLMKHGVPKENLTVLHVPGAVEIPLAAKLLAKTKQFDAIICHGAVIRGDTDHYDYVCEQLSQGCQQVMMTFDIPVIFGVLTTHNLQQAEERIGGIHGHKGIEAADAALCMINIVKEWQPISA